MTVMVENLMQQDTMVGFVDVGGIVVKVLVPYKTTCQWEGAVVGTLDQQAQDVQIPKGRIRAQNWEQRTWVSRGGAPLPIGPGPVGGYAGIRPPGAISYLQLGNFSQAAGAPVGGYGSGAGGSGDVSGTLVHATNNYPADTLTQLGHLLGTNVPAGVQENGGDGGIIWRCLAVVNCQSPTYYLNASFSTIGEDPSPIIAAVAPNGTAVALVAGAYFPLTQVGNYFFYAMKNENPGTITSQIANAFGVTYPFIWSTSLTAGGDAIQSGGFDTQTDGICPAVGATTISTGFPSGSGTMSPMVLQATYGYTLEAEPLAQTGGLGEYYLDGLQPYYYSTFAGTIVLGTAPSYSLGGDYTWDVLLDNVFILETTYGASLQIISNDTFPLPPAGGVFGTPLSTATFIPTPAIAYWANSGASGGGPNAGTFALIQLTLANVG